MGEEVKWEWFSLRIFAISPEDLYEPQVKIIIAGLKVDANTLLQLGAYHIWGLTPDGYFGPSL